MTLDRENKIKAVKELMSKEKIGSGEACERVGLSRASFYGGCSEMKRKQTEGSRKTYAGQLNITDLPAMPQQSNQLFLIYGSPQLLAEFTKAIQ
jgi:ACT domain-containing protein